MLFIYNTTVNEESEYESDEEHYQKLMTQETSEEDDLKRQLRLETAYRLSTKLWPEPTYASFNAQY
ncbi:hypothetical protein BpHYR1_027104 [Brachionus plicatilis]|uniref:Uncharacterized protein n=1 Tax=Brachionus plicatilis TaxID=10195 RepID=A0A3M7Q750_BRAPC|nr:hypothetical protein BpHYR1_027104 [Brachionus plicatilis]